MNNPEVNILQLISTSGHYGAENVVLELSKGLREKGYNVYIGVLASNKEHALDLSKFAKRAGFETLEMLFHGKISINKVMTLRDFLLSRHINIIHSHNYKSNFYSLIASTGLPMQRYSTCHNWPGLSFKMQCYKVLDMIQLRRFDKVIAVSDAVEAQLRRWGIKRNRTLVIQNGVDTDKFSAKRDGPEIRKQLGIGPTQKVIGTVSRLTEEKGHTYIIQAARELQGTNPETVFLIVGDGPLMDKLKNDAVGLPVIFAGHRSDVDVIYAAMDIFILPSLNEGLPMVLLEAMCSGLPAIASNVGNVSNVINGTQVGILIQPENLHELLDALKSLLNDEMTRKTIGNRGKERIVNLFSRNAMAQRYHEIYQLGYPLDSGYP